MESIDEGRGMRRIKDVIWMDTRCSSVVWDRYKILCIGTWELNVSFFFIELGNCTHVLDSNFLRGIFLLQISILNGLNEIFGISVNTHIFYDF